MRLGAAEDPDWGYARNRSIVLKSQLAEFSASSFSTQIGIGGLPFYGGNRDYPWQGLIVGPLRGKLYKALDGVYYSTGRGLRARGIQLQGSSWVYEYEEEGGEPFRVSVSLASEKGVAALKISGDRPCGFAPMLDLTATDMWPPGEHSWEVDGSRALATGSNVPFQVRFNGFDEVRSVDLALSWTYKLGDGFREQTDGGIMFSQRTREIHVPAILHSPEGELRIEVQDARGRVGRPDQKETRAPIPGSDLVAKALELRIRGLSSFGVSVEGTWFPEAGAWWFRQPWVRDCLEGLRWNLSTYVKALNWSTRLQSLLGLLMKSARNNQGLPLILGGGDAFSSDAPPQLLNVACSFAEVSENLPMAREVLDLARFICQRILEGKAFSASVLRKSIICSPANSSWVDSVVSGEEGRWPTRLPGEWRDGGIDPFAREYGLVEVNALYVEALARVTGMCDRHGLRPGSEVEDLSAELSNGFRRRFKVVGQLPSLTVAPSLGLADSTPGSPSAIASSVVGEALYKSKELQRIWQVISDRLLVHRRLVVLGDQRHPFGIIVKDSPPTPYLGDAEYHGAVIWPRDTPYLIGLMERLGRDVNGLLLNNLDHMISEGAVGYCSELFSLPVGPNPSPSDGSQNPVPVKNPAQFWSQWCDPYFGRTDGLARFLGNS
jgi:hypothetical protein